MRAPYQREHDMMGRRTGTLLGVATILTGALYAREASAQQSNPPNTLAGVGGGGNSGGASTAQLQRALVEANGVVLDARPYEEYAVSHIPGARSVRGKAGTTPALYVADVTQVMESLADREHPVGVDH